MHLNRVSRPIKKHFVRTIRVPFLCLVCLAGSVVPATAGEPTGG